MSTTPTLKEILTNSATDRFMAHRDEDPKNPGHWKNGEPITYAGGIGIARIGFNVPAGGKVVSLSIDDPEGTTHFYNKTVTVPKAKDRPGNGETQVSASFLIPACKEEHTVLLKAKCGGVEVTKAVTVYP